MAAPPSAMGVETMHRMLNRRPLVVSALAFPLSTWAAPWPTRPLRIVLPFAAGGSSDLVARLLADKLGQALGSPVVVESRAGANGIIASDRKSTRLNSI